MTLDPRQRPRRRRLGASVAVTALATTAIAAGATTPALAYNTVSVAGGDAWNVHDAASPGIDTGSVMDTDGRALMGYGGLRVDVAGGDSPLNGILLRGFELTFDGLDTFTTEQGVSVDGVVVQRELHVDRGTSTGRFFDSFTNSTGSPVSVSVAFGGQLGYDTGTNQSAIAGTSSGDLAISDDDGWVSWYSPTDGAGSASQNGPSATTVGTPGYDGSLERMGTFLRDPFSNDLPASGDEANHPAFVNTLTIDPGETLSLATFVVTGLSETTEITDGAAIPPAGSQVAAVQERAAALTEAPDFSDLTSAEVCSLANYDLTALAVDCTAPAGGIQDDVPVASPVTLRTSVAYDVVGKTITDLRRDMDAGTTSAEQITQAYLDRIAAYDRGPFGLHSVITVAPTALAQARAADAARAAGDDRPLLGIPILVKDIVDTIDMPTTGGSLVFDGYQPTADSWQVAKLREAGAIILGKANLAEFANDGHFSPSAYGQVWNAFDPSRSSIGSSGGSAVAVASSFAAAAIGTQTGDSLWGPAGAASLFSLRGTDGMQSSAGTMPLTLIQDYVGFITQSTDDLALLLEATAVDNPDDVLDDVANGHRPDDWMEYLSEDALEGKVIGIPEGAFIDPFGTPETSEALQARFAQFEAAGATLVEMPAAPSAPGTRPGGDLGYEGWAQWIDAHPDNPYTLAEQITRSPLRIPTRVNTTPYTGTGRMSDAEQRAFEQWRAGWRTALGEWMDTSGVDAVLYATELSDIHLNDSVIPSFGRIDPQSSGAGVPTVVFPAGVNVHGNPVGFQLQGKEFQDAELLGFAYAFDAVEAGRVLPSISPALAYAPAAPAQVVAPLPALAQAQPVVPWEPEPPTEEPTEPPVEEPTEPPVEEPTETPTEVPTETPTDVPTETPTGPAPGQGDGDDDGGALPGDGGPVSGGPGTLPSTGVDGIVMLWAALAAAGTGAALLAGTGVRKRRSILSEV
ncbi:amidase family protein [Georgenia sp. MJ206]|uniref:amidase family protein n=1 Tax=Georgenia wangjunii TaxID=3117730 RepID=UPI002F268FA6